MRLDGFVSLDAGFSTGQVLTKPVEFQGNVLRVNADASGGGSIRVELQDVDGHPIEGYREQDASFVSGNAVRLPVSWGSKMNLSQLRQRPIRLRFMMKDCKLYSYQFVD